MQCSWKLGGRWRKDLSFIIRLVTHWMYGVFPVSCSANVPQWLPSALCTEITRHSGAAEPATASCPSLNPPAPAHRAASGSGPSCLCKCCFFGLELSPHCSCIISSFRCQPGPVSQGRPPRCPGPAQHPVRICLPFLQGTSFTLQLYTFSNGSVE